MSGGVTRTFELLTATANEAAVDCLLCALDSTDHAIQEQALRAILLRGSLAGQREVLRRWNSLDERLKAIVLERPGRIHGALREAILEPDRADFENAAAVMLWAKEYDLMPVLVAAAEDRAHPRANEAAQTLIALAELLYDELASPRDYVNRRDPQLVRCHVLTSLETSAARYFEHRRGEILDAFLLLANRENATLKRILFDAHDRCHAPLLAELSTSARPGVMRLLLAYLDDPHAPFAPLSIVARRNDRAFLGHLLRKLSADSTAPTLKANLQRLETIVWLENDLSRLAELADCEQHGALTLALHSGMKRPQVFEIVRFLLENGGEESRRAAAGALVEFKGPQANKLALAALEDSDPQVQASVIGQLRDRRIPGAMSKLLEHADSPHEAVRRAVQHSLAEFTFKRYLAAFDMLKQDVRRSTGALVRKVDPEAMAQLRQELAAHGRTRRLRALHMTAFMSAAAEVEIPLIELLADEDAALRLEAARLLAGCDSQQTRQALRLAMLDHNSSVQQAAEQSLRRLALDHPISRSPAETPR